MTRVLLAAALLCAALSPAAYASPGPEWTRYGAGAVGAGGIAIGDTNGDGSTEPVIAGRGAGVVLPASLEDGRFGWFNKWAGAPEPLGDRVGTEAVALADLNRDGARDVLVGTDAALFAIDGRTGSTLWSARDNPADGYTFVGAHYLALGDFNSDGVQDAAFCERLDDEVTAVDGRDGSFMFSYPRPSTFLSGLATGDLDGDGTDDLVVIGKTQGAGPDVHAVSPVGSGISGTPTLLWAQTFTGSRVASVTIGDFRAGGSREVAVGGQGGIEIRDGLTGRALSTLALASDETAGRVLAADLDADADQELAANVVKITSGQDPRGFLRALDANAAALWTLELPAPPAGLAVGADRTVYAGGGWTTFGGKAAEDGFVVAGRAGEVLWERGLPEAVHHLALGRPFGRPALLAGQTGFGGDGSGLVAFDPSTGDDEWDFRTGGRVRDIDAVDLDGDGLPEILEGADDSTVAVHDSKGDLLWHQRVPGRGGPDVPSVAAGELGGSEGLEVLAGTYEYARPGPAGRVHAYSAAGEPLWTHRVVVENVEGSRCDPSISLFSGTVESLEVRDIDSDGATDVIYGASAPDIYDPCGAVGRLDASGEPVWERPLPVGTNARMAMRDLNGDGVEDLAVTRNTISNGGGVYAIDGRDGSELWFVPLADSTQWADPGPNGVVAGDLSGTVHLLDAADGTTIWSAKHGVAAWHGEQVQDVTGDGIQDVVAGYYDEATRLLDGADGSVVWSSPTGAERWSFRLAEISGGEVPMLAAGHFGSGLYAPAALQLMDLRTGEIRATFASSGPVLDLTAADLDGDGAEEALAGAGWQLTALRAFEPGGKPVGGGLGHQGSDFQHGPTHPGPQQQRPGGEQENVQLPAPPPAAPQSGPRLRITIEAAKRRGRLLGRLVLPSGVDRAQACTGKVKVRRGKRSRTARLRRDCTFAVKLPRGRGRVKARYGGSNALKPARWSEPRRRAARRR